MGGAHRSGVARERLLGAGAPASRTARYRPLGALLDGLPPASGAVVMGTGIVSVALHSDGRETLSRVLLALAALAWVVLALLLPLRALRDRARFRQDVALPASFTSVAGTAVLGARFSLLGWTHLGEALLALSALFWLTFAGPVLSGWRTPTVGASFIVTVGTESLALLAATLALASGAQWLLLASLVPFALGVALYALVLARFDATALAHGEGDHWVTGGALAISTIAAGRIALACPQSSLLSGATGLFEGISLALWALAIAWLPVLLFCELRWPRLRYSVRRWSTVFPVGMYAACSFVVGEGVSALAITSFARVWVWVALGVWAAVAGGLLRAAVRLVSPARAPHA